MSAVRHRSSASRRARPTLPAASVSPTDHIVQRQVPVPDGAWLVVVVGPDRGKAIQLTDESLTIGKSTSADLTLTDDAVSRRHLSVTRDGALLVVRDLGSTNGVYVGGVRVDQARVGLGAPIELGRSVFVASRSAGEPFDDPRLTTHLRVRLARDGTWFVSPDGNLVDLSGQRLAVTLLAVLARGLATSPGTAVPTPDIVREVWPGDRSSPRSLLNRLRVLANELRRKGMGVRLRGVRGGYLLDPQSVALDDAPSSTTG